MTDRENGEDHRAADEEPQTDAGGSGSRTPPPRDYEIGHGRPPRKHQFQPGQSGNPNGRPKRVPTPDEVFRQVAKMPVTITENGKKRKIMTDKAIFMRLRRECLEGKPQALRLWFDFLARHAPEQTAQSFASLEAEDQRLLAEYSAKLLRDGNAGGNDVGGI